MVRHIILWKLKESLSPEEKAAVKRGMKSGLEGLVGEISGLLSAEVSCEGLASSTADVMLHACFENAAALQAYRTHPSHVRVADTLVRPYVAVRSCFDVETEDSL